MGRWVGATYFGDLNLAFSEEVDEVSLLGFLVDEVIAGERYCI